MKKTILSLLLGSSCMSAADVTLPKILTSNMVLQRDVPITIWGWADAGEAVQVSLAHDSAKTTADAEGNWKVTLPKRGLGKSLRMKVKGKNEILLDNILMGDVWLCSGQSNMEWGIGEVENAAEEIKAANHPTLRLFDVGKVKSKKPLKDIAKGMGWNVCTSETIAVTGTRKGFSAVGYFFGKYLQKGLGNVPIGLIDSSWGGSRIEPWTTPEGHESIDEVKNKKGDYSSMYNAMVHGLSPLAIKGVIWYQGESNRKDGALYHHRQRALVNGWRKIWGVDMPFYFVQLAPFDYSSDKGAEFLPELWEAQSKSNAEIPNTGMAVTIDVGNSKNIHPKKKKEVGQRLALLALKDTYGKDIVAYSPTYASHRIKDTGSVLVTFKDVGGGLVAGNNGEVKGFEIAGKDGVFYPADAKVVSETQIRIHSFNSKVKNPVQVRYAWSNTPDVNLSNKEGLPVGSFRF